MSDDIKWSNKDERTEAATEAVLYLLNSKSKTPLFGAYEHIRNGNGSVYIARLVDVPVPDEDGDLNHELCWYLKVNEDKTFAIQQWGKERPHRYDDRSVDCDTLDEAFKWIKRRAATFGKRRDEARKAEADRKVRQEKRAALGVERKKTWKELVAAFLPGAYCDKSTYHQEKASVAGEASGYGPRIQVTVENLEPHIAGTEGETIDPLTAMVHVQWDGDPALALQFAAKCQAVAAEMGLTFPQSGRDTVPYTKAFTKRSN